MGAIFDEIYFARGNHGEAEIYEFRTDVMRRYRQFKTMQALQRGEFGDLHVVARTPRAIHLATRMTCASQ